MRIIPAIDIINGKCVRLTKGDYNFIKVYNEHPLEVAKQYEAAGIQYLHLVDLDGAKSNRIVNYKVLEQITSKTNLKVEFGGGLKSNKDIDIAFNSGVCQVIGGSVAVKNSALFQEWINKYGSDKIILGADHVNQKIAVNGWKETSTLDLTDFIRGYLKKGIEYVVCTDIARDGMLEGPSVDLYRKIQEQSQNKIIKLIASGGVASLNDLSILKRIGCEGVIIGKAIYENKISLKQLKKII